MRIKDVIYEKEEQFLSPFATKSKNTKGRVKSEEECSTRTDFQRDKDRIVYSKAFMRLKNKTQVFFSPEGDHYMTRLTHTLDVSQIARSIARCLMLNEDLTEAIALGHDLGHTPFGHAGERCLDKLNPSGFLHNEQSLRGVDILENDMKGLNLTFEVRDGILNHKMSGKPSTLEGQVVSLSDRIAYLNHDVDDAIRSGVITINDIPKHVIEVLGDSSRKRINAMVTSVYESSYGKNEISLSTEVKSAMDELRAFMFKNVYHMDKAMSEEKRAYNMFSTMYSYYANDLTKLPNNYYALIEKYGKDTVICDYLSSMTDRYAIKTFKEIYVPKNFDD